MKRKKVLVCYDKERVISTQWNNTVITVLINIIKKCWTKYVCHESCEGAHGIDRQKNSTGKINVINEEYESEEFGREAIKGGVARTPRGLGSRSTVLNLNLTSGLIMAWPAVSGFVVPKQFTK